MRELHIGRHASLSADTLEESRRLEVERGYVPIAQGGPVMTLPERRELPMHPLDRQRLEFQK